MSIPFTQYLRPDGRKKPISVEMPKEIEESAYRFIEAGGWYEAEVLEGGIVSLTACFVTEDDGPQDIAIELADNGPGIKESVAKLVYSSVEYVK